jgi:hypothetical protein
MTAKHFRLIAGIIHQTRITGLPAEREAARRMMYTFRDEFNRQFPRFDEEKFVKACGDHIIKEEPNLCYRCKRETAVPENIGPCYECQCELHATGDYNMDGEDDLPF